MASWVGALRLQAIITGIVCASTVALAAPGSDRSSAQPAARGADIARGIAFVLAPEWNYVHRSALRRIRDDVGAKLRADRIGYDALRISGGAVRFRVREASAIGRAQEGLAHAARSWNLTPAASMPGLSVRAAPDGEFTLLLTASASRRCTMPSSPPRWPS